MERTSFTENGVLRLPPGFRFHPTDEELVVQYLKRKVLSCPLPAAVIPEINLGRLDPWDLPGEGEGERYFFNRREITYPNTSSGSRATPSGYWKVTGKITPVVAPASRELIGAKKVLVFHRGKLPHGRPTGWIMHEYHCLFNSVGASTFARRKSLVHSCVRQSKDWAVCRIFKKRAQLTATCQSSSSSCVTDLDEEEGEEGCSSCNSSPGRGRVPLSSLLQQSS